LKEELKAQGQPVGGKKEELIERLVTILPYKGALTEEFVQHQGGGLPQAAPIGLIQIPAFPRLEEEEEEEEEEGEGDEEETEEEETEETVSPVGEIQWQHALILGDIL